MRALVLCLIAVASSSSCAVGPRYLVQVSSLADSSLPTGKSFILLPGTVGLESSDLQFREFASYVSASLQRRGYAVAQNVEHADLAIFLSYGIGDPQTAVYTRTVPVYGTIPGQSATINLSSYGSEGYSSTSGTVTTAPQRAQVGTQNITEESTTFFRYLILDALDLSAYPKAGKVLPLWKTLTTSSGRSGDLRLVLPILVAASEKYLGNSTGREIQVVLSESDPAVALVRSANK